MKFLRNNSTSWAIPWNHVPELFLKNFVGSRETYWGSNFGKLHSEYLGLPVVALAALGAGTKQDRKSTRLNSSHGYISYAVFCLKKKQQPPPGAEAVPWRGAQLAP